MKSLQSATGVPQMPAHRSMMHMPARRPLLAQPGVQQAQVFGGVVAVALSQDSQHQPQPHQRPRAPSADFFSRIFSPPDGERRGVCTEPRVTQRCRPSRPTPARPLGPVPGLGVRPRHAPRRAPPETDPCSALVGLKQLWQLRCSHNHIADLAPCGQSRRGLTTFFFGGTPSNGILPCI